MAYEKLVVMQDGKLAGSVIVGEYLLEKLGIQGVKSAEYAVLWEAWSAFRKVDSCSSRKDLDRIVENKYKPSPKAKGAYQTLSNILDNLYNKYGVTNG